MVRFENVGLRYGLGPEILRDLNFLIPAHSFQFLTGPSGAGKTSLLRLLFLSLRPTRGLVNLFGNDVSMLGKDDIANLRGRSRRRVAVVFQQFNLVNRLTAFENVLAGRLGYVPAWRGWLRHFTRADRLLAFAAETLEDGPPRRIGERPEQHVIGTGHLIHNLSVID